MWKAFIGESQTKAVHDYWHIPSKICHAIIFIQVVYSKKVQTFYALNRDMNEIPSTQV